MAGDACPYVLGELLGKGGQGTTFRAVDPASGEVVAVKRFRLADAASWKGYELFVRECDALRSLAHPAIPRFLAAGGDHATGALWLAMELVPGESLADRMRRGGGVAAAEVTRIARALCEVLGYLHARLPPVIHRDIKPANILVGPARIALVDFGSVRSVLRPEGGTTVVGTFGYFAPEQLHGEATAASDLYALGVTIAAIASGLEGTALPRAGLAIDVERVIPATEPALRRFVRALTRPEPADRPVSAAAAMALLDASEAQPSDERAERVPAVPALPAPLPLPVPPVGIVRWALRLPIWVLFWFLRALVVIARSRLPHRYRRRRQHLLTYVQYGGDRLLAARELERVHRQEARATERLERARTRLDRARQRIGGGPSRVTNKR